MTLYLFAGPNGSGKSTIIAQYIKENNLKNVEYICPDIYAQSIFSNIKDEKERYISAIKFSEYKRTKLLNENKPLIVETVLSRIDKIDFVKLAKEKGYKVISIFVCTNSPEINIGRVENHVSEGGHDVPTDRLKDRYYKSLENLKPLYETSDEIYIYDNTVKPRLVAAKIDDVNYIAENAPDWAKIED